MALNTMMALPGLMGQTPTPQSGLMGPQPNRLNSLLGNPLLNVGLNLLAARQDGRINPYLAAQQGLLQAQQFKDSRRRQSMEEEELELRRQMLENQMSRLNRPTTLERNAQLFADAEGHTGPVSTEHLLRAGAPAATLPQRTVIAGEEFLRNPLTGELSHPTGRSIEDVLGIAAEQAGDVAESTAEGSATGAATVASEEDAKQAGRRYANATQKYERLTDTLGTAIGLVSPTTTGLTGSVAKEVPGTSAYDLANALETVKANIGIDALQEMRANSPTGGALGNVSNFELRGLQATIESLDQAQDDATLLSNLRKVRQHLDNLYQMQRLDFERKQGRLTDDQINEYIAPYVNAIEGNAAGRRPEYTQEEEAWRRELQRELGG